MKPHKYQSVGVLKIKKFKGRALLADEMGLGKSMQALRWAKKYGKGPIIVVCPASLKWNWENECRLQNLSAEILEGRKIDKRHRFNKDTVIIINYDILKTWLPRLIKFKASTVILDESHYVKSLEANRTIFTKELCDTVPHVIGLTGTPIDNRPVELWSQLNIIKPELFPSFTDFAFRYCKPKKTRWGWQYKGATRTRELNLILRSEVMIRRKKKDVLKDLPAKSIYMVPLSLKNQAEYNTAHRQFVKWVLANYGAGRAKKAQRAEALIKSNYLKRLAAKLKFPFVIEWIQTFLEQSDEKLLVFAHHKAAVRTLHRKFPNSVVVSGDVKGKKRQLAVDKFQKDPKTRLFIGNIAAAGVGLNLTAASTVAFAELPWTPSGVGQCIDRAHRIGQKKPVSAFFLVANHSIESHLCEVIQEKQRVIDKVIDGVETEVSELDLLDTLLVRMEQTYKNGKVRIN